MKKLDLETGMKQETLEEDLKSAFEQGRSFQYDSGIASKSKDSMNIKDFKSWYKERFITGSIDIMGIKNNSK